MRVPGVPFDQGSHPQGSLSPTAIVLHRTYGAWGGSYSVGKNGRSGVGIGFHFLIGKQSGQWVQFYDTVVKAAHAKGANSWSVGIEFEGVNEQPLTDWQVRAGAWIIAAVAGAHNIPKTYYTGPRQQVAGLLPHASVPGSDHTDKITDADFARMAAAWSAAPAPAPAPAPSPIDWPKLRRFAAAVLAGQLASVKTVRLNDTGPWVKQIQQALNLLTGTKLAEDGKFGASTETALKNFQRFFKLSPDGVAGPKTLSTMRFMLQAVADGKA